MHPQMKHVRVHVFRMDGAFFIASTIRKKLGFSMLTAIYLGLFQPGWK